MWRPGNNYGLTTILVGTGYGSGIRSQEEKGRDTSGI